MMTKEEFTTMLRDSITTVLREKIASGRIVIASNLGVDGLAAEMANNSACAPWMEICSERELQDETLASASEWREDVLHELLIVDAILERNGIPHAIEGDSEPLDISVRVGMLSNKILHPSPTFDEVARGPIKLETCECTTPVFTCASCNKLPSEH